MSLISQKVDTVLVYKSDVEFFLSNTLYIGKDGYDLNSQTSNKESYDIIKRIEYADSILSKEGYFKFLDSNSNCIEEGRWNLEYFSGYYKKHFPNGAIQEEGYFTETCDSTFYPGQKIGYWKYYNSDGKLGRITKESPLIRRDKSLFNYPLPPCNCSQEKLYTNKLFGTIQQKDLRGKSYTYSTNDLLKQVRKDSLLEIEFIRKYSGDFIDSVRKWGECINNGIFVVKIFKFNMIDTSLSFSISYIKQYEDLQDIVSDRYTIIKERVVFIKLINGLRNISLRSKFMELKSVYQYKGLVSPYVDSKKSTIGYTGEYILFKRNIKATIFPPYYMIDSDISIYSD